jgi:NAD(P)-dependent dehydrogenase (short-subunit alcohol dehydrogenase family)
LKGEDESVNIIEKFKMDGRKVYVTGAGRGIGKAVAIALCSAGADVAFVAKHEESAAKAAEEAAKTTGAKTISIGADISQPDDVKRMFATIIAEFDTIDGGFNNAGVANVDMPAEDIPYESLNEIMQINVIGTYMCCQEAAKIMIPKKGGSIVNMASMSAHIVNIPQKTSNYQVSKAGVVTMTKNFAVEWAPHNVRVNSISPGYTATELAASFSKEQIATWKGMIPMGRMEDPEELAGAVLYFLSDASTYTTGADLIIDGGYTLW